MKIQNKKVYYLIVLYIMVTDTFSNVKENDGSLKDNKNKNDKKIQNGKSKNVNIGNKKHNEKHSIFNEENNPVKLIEYNNMETQNTDSIVKDKSKNKLIVKVTQLCKKAFKHLFNKKKMNLGSDKCEKYNIEKVPNNDYNSKFDYDSQSKLLHKNKSEDIFESYNKISEYQQNLINEKIEYNNQVQGIQSDITEEDSSIVNSNRFKKDSEKCKNLNVKIDSKDKSMEGRKNRKKLNNDEEYFSSNFVMEIEHDPEIIIVKSKNERKSMSNKKHTNKHKKTKKDSTNNSLTINNLLGLKSCIKQKDSTSTDLNDSVLNNEKENKKVSFCLNDQESSITNEVNLKNDCNKKTKSVLYNMKKSELQPSKMKKDNKIKEKNDQPACTKISKINNIKKLKWIRKHMLESESTEKKESKPRYFRDNTKDSKIYKYNQNQFNKMKKDKHHTEKKDCVKNLIRKFKKPDFIMHSGNVYDNPKNNLIRTERKIQKTDKNLRFSKPLKKFELNSNDEE